MATVIGTNVPAMPITAERVAGLPEWKDYLDRSLRQQHADQNFFHVELKSKGLAQAIMPPGSPAPRGTPLNRPDEWYAQPEARRIADCVISYQTPAGGWSKHTDFTKHVRAPGEAFAVDNSSRYVISNDFDIPADVNWNYIGTFDNDATYTELRFLAKVITANLNATNNQAWRAAFSRGLNYIFSAQFPNGGWPQVWPLQGGYHDEITYNDDAMLHVIELLQGVANGQDEFAFAPSALRKHAAASYRRGIECLLATQMTVNGRRTVWCQQNDAITLQAASARNYEMPSLASGESASIVMFLMQQPHPDSNVIAAVHAAVAWFKKTEVMNVAYQRTDNGRELVPSTGSGPLWARYYQIGTDQPVFGDRDKSIHDRVNDLSRERRNGYGWYGGNGAAVLERYPEWAKAHPANE